MLGKSYSLDACGSDEITRKHFPGEKASKPQNYEQAPMLLDADRIEKSTVLRGPGYCTQLSSALGKVPSLKNLEKWKRLWNQAVERSWEGFEEGLKKLFMKSAQSSRSF